MAGLQRRRWRRVERDQDGQTGKAQTVRCSLGHVKNLAVIVEFFFGGEGVCEEQQE